MRPRFRGVPNDLPAPTSVDPILSYVNAESTLIAS